MRRGRGAERAEVTLGAALGLSSPVGVGAAVAMARSVGVPELWIEDAVQDIAVALWRNSLKPSVGPRGYFKLVHDAAASAARKYGKKRNSHYQEPAYLTTNVPCADPYLRVELIIDATRLLLAMRRPRLWPTSPRRGGYLKERVACPKGHLYTRANTRVERSPEGRRRRKCRECKRIINKRTWARRKGAG